MVDEVKATRQVKSKLRSRIAIGLLVFVILFVGYGAFERSRLLADVENEKKACLEIKALQGAVIESTVQDWRVVFVNDQPQVAQRVGGVYIPHEGKGPGYTQKVAKQLQALELCKTLFISYGPVSGGMKMGPTPKQVLKPGEVPPEPLDLKVIRNQFPQLTVSGEEFLSQEGKSPAEQKPVDDKPAKKEGEQPKEKSASSNANP